MLSSDSELGAVFKNTELPGCYVDPLLEHYPVMYAGFVADMYRFKLVRVDVTPVSKCGFFLCVEKAQARRYGSVASGDRRAEVQQIVPQAPMVPVV